MKKYLIRLAVISAALALLLSGCAGKNTDTPDDSTVPDSSEITTQEITGVEFKEATSEDFALLRNMCESIDTSFVGDNNQISLDSKSADFSKQATAITLNSFIYTFLPEITDEGGYILDEYIVENDPKGILDNGFLDIIKVSADGVDDVIKAVFNTAPYHDDVVYMPGSTEGIEPDSIAVGYYDNGYYYILTPDSAFHPGYEVSDAQMDESGNYTVALFSEFEGEQTNAAVVAKLIEFNGEPAWTIISYAS